MALDSIIGDTLGYHLDYDAEVSDCRRTPNAYDAIVSKFILSGERSAEVRIARGITSGDVEELEEAARYTVCGIRVVFDESYGRLWLEWIEY